MNGNKNGHKGKQGKERRKMATITEKYCYAPKSLHRYGIKELCSKRDFPIKLVPLKAIEYYGNKYVFKNLIHLIIIKRQGYYTAEYKALNIYSCEKSMKEVLESFSEQFNMMWKSYVLENNENLTDDAIEYKNKLLNFAEEVQLV
jgi:hypothetical protein